MGLEEQHQITSATRYGLKIQLEDWDGKEYTAVYGTYKIGNEASGYKLTLEDFGDASSTIPDSMLSHNLNGMMFSTHDKDNDKTEDTEEKLASKEGGKPRRFKLFNRSQELEDNLILPKNEENN